MPFDPEFVRPLAQVQNEFLQVLLTKFSLRRQGSGVHLDVSFGFDTPAVWLRRGKNHIRQRLDDERIDRYNAQLESILLQGRKTYHKHDDPEFPFRFGNGGTLPVIRIGGTDYYCLFYREMHPAGWNIANGGADSLSELLDPTATIERELREELIVVEPHQACRYVFAADEGQPADHPDFAIARRIWKEVFRRRNFPDLTEKVIPLKWLPGNDSLTVQFADQPPTRTDNVLININADDFGIEIDRVAKLEVGPEAILCDGELIRARLLNRVVGLFEVQKVNAAIAVGRTEFKPDRIFYSGRDRSSDSIDRVVNDYLHDITRGKVISSDVLADYKRIKEKFGLCPVTRNVIKRYLLMEDRAPVSASSRTADSYDIFLSFSSEDRNLARKVFTFLRRAGSRVFFSDETLHHTNFASAVDQALEVARAFVVVGTRLDRLQKPWVQYEWMSFHNDILSGRKPGNTPLLTLVSNVDPHAFPRPLCFRQVITCDPIRPEPALRQLRTFLP